MKNDGDFSVKLEYPLLFIIYYLKDIGVVRSTTLCSFKVGLGLVGLWIGLLHADWPHSIADLARSAGAREKHPVITSK